MGYFGEDFLQGFFGADGLKDYTHASKTFRTNGYELSPRTKFLFHVFFNINTGQIPSLQSAFGNNDIATIGLMVKSMQLPSYNISIDTMNQYNRKRLVQSKIDYQPVQVVFNDDQGDLIRYMWYMYYSYYYKDPQQKYDNTTNINGSIGQLQTLQNGFDYNNRDIYEGSRQVSDWGYVGEAYQDSNIFTGSNTTKPPFFRDIKIYGLSQKKFASYVLVNPMIENWQHDTYDYSQGGSTMTNTVTIKYETVKYYTGYVGGSQPSNTVTGFADPSHYDTRRSGISRPGSTNTVFGQGGIVDAGIGLYEDLNALTTGRGGLAQVIGAVQAGNALYNAIKNPKQYRQALKTELEQLKKEAAVAATQFGINSITQNSGRSDNFPT
jgi:hypothetical protein